MSGRVEEARGLPVRRSRESKSTVVVWLATAIAAVGGVLLGWLGSDALAIALALFVALVAGGIFRLRLIRAVLAFVFIGYLFLGKGFAYLGHPPIYVGETALLLGLVGVAVSLATNGAADLRRRVTTWDAIVFAAFVGWNGIILLRGLPVHGIETLRDGAVWGYAAFALVVATVLPTRSVPRVARIAMLVVPFYLVWLVFGFWATKLGKVTIGFPGSPVPVIWLKSGDVGVHLGGIAAALLLRIDKVLAPYSRLKMWLVWLLWGVDWVLFTASNRGGMLSALLPIAVVVAMKPLAKWDRPLILLLIVLIILGATGIAIPVGPQEVSVSQFADNFGSLIGGGDDVLSATVHWRLDWWTDIVNDTVFGKYWLTGRGYGINLALEYGFANPGDDQSVNRSPHSVFMTYLGRAGIPGLVLWCLVLTRISVAILTSYRRRYDMYAALRLAVFGYLAAFVLNASVDVFLEGPMGGILFWSVVGYAFCLRQDLPVAVASVRRVGTEYLSRQVGF